jgi:hypothetical protein
MRQGEETSVAQCRARRAHTACRGGAPACVFHSPRRRRHTRWLALGVAASTAEARTTEVTYGSARAIGQREEQEDTLLVLPRLFGGYTYAGELACAVPCVGVVKSTSGC